MEPRERDEGLHSVDTLKAKVEKSPPQLTGLEYAE